MEVVNVMAQLVPVEASNDHPPMYRGNDIREKADRVIELGGGLLAVNGSDDGWVEFSLFEICGSDDTCRHIFNGGGPSGSLREMRHTYWGSEEGREAGYVFSCPAKLIMLALEVLGRWFYLE